ncbi:MarR family transcriptional regulator [Rhizobium subbaraonis]|uniref:MarR family transcriptional regulator n=1 Tax=Rhizobium subbaraonis TaxID=908946 RepID=A0A285UHL1_9HYPH|nr:MarR family transcriptional regulator [Rhizobium subbaraonis]SOC40888.1 MarR family transcriptional regulator [Rhizobium subbaraonis]
MDHVDRIIAQWNRERPDLDVGPMALLGRLNRVRQHLGREIEQVLAEHGLSVAGFDVLATLRRSGAPFRLSPGDLLATTMVTSGTMTNRIDQLEKEGLVERIKNPDDGRSVLIALTPEGRERVDRAVEAHVANQHRLVDGLDARQREELDAALRALLAAFE